MEKGDGLNVSATVNPYVTTTKTYLLGQSQKAAPQAVKLDQFVAEKVLVVLKIAYVREQWFVHNCL